MKHEPGMVTLDKLKFHIQDLLDRYRHPELYNYVNPTTVPHFAEQLVEQLERCHAIEPADNVLVLQTSAALDVQMPNTWTEMRSLTEAANLIQVGYPGHWQIRKVARDERPPDGALWFVEALDEDGETVTVRRWQTGHFDSSD